MRKTVSPLRHLPCTFSSLGFAWSPKCGREKCGRGNADQVSPWIGLSGVVLEEKNWGMYILAFFTSHLSVFRRALFVFEKLKDSDSWIRDLTCFCFGCITYGELQVTSPLGPHYPSEDGSSSSTRG